MSVSELKARLEKVEKELAWLKAQFYVEERDGGWTASYKSFLIPAWDDTPYSKTRKQGFHYKTLDEAIQGAMKRDGTS